MAARTVITRRLLAPLAASAALLVGCGEYDSTPNTQVTSAETTPSAGGAPADAEAPEQAAAAQPIAFTVRGMHCDGCASFLTESLAKLDGVASCEVSFADSRALIVPRSDEDALLVLAAAKDEVEALGYHVGDSAADDAATADATPKAAEETADAAAGTGSAAAETPANAASSTAG